MSTESISLTITYRGVTHPLSLLPDETVAMLQARLEELTSVPPSHQKLLLKGKKLADEKATVRDAGLKDGMKVQLLGPTAEEIGGLKKTEDEQHRRDRILRERASKPQAKVRSTASPSSAASSTYKIHKIEPLPHLPNPESARALLQRLAEDPAIRHVMQKHQFAVGVLTELAPHEHPELLGLNVNAGQAIKLRLRTDRYDGFRNYREVRRVLCHELTHNVHGDHDNNFKELNSKLNKEVAEYETSVSQGTHRLADAWGGIYEPSTGLEAEAHAHVLGGGVASGRVASGDTPEERRRRVLEATMRRLQKEEEELEQSCGTAGPSAMT
ncbi:WLM-domain-containing protein [Gloeophyllum trabeum ATCC 11539]|uniref:WLM-domain-containing protein n=1 Tax=Gloeophyllum trabeum (strain ATCC 11539 / FP-39264 / Madison 617) TaxID=670483 RepID=S7Q9N6_GLOTA|nr:WLM-domain-containing protein [Gloeophyllum trabeum ATCC 11539]EPQ56232.1 WLM-domain-containing protein [Gloeophyllum trabeum ATCC 11539]